MGLSSLKFWQGRAGRTGWRVRIRRHPQYLADLSPNKELGKFSRKDQRSEDASFLSESRILTEVSKDSLLWQRGAVVRRDALPTLNDTRGQSRDLLVGANALLELRNRECRGRAVLRPMWHAA